MILSREQVSLMLLFELLARWMSTDRWNELQGPVEVGFGLFATLSNTNLAEHREERRTYEIHRRKRTITCDIHDCRCILVKIVDCCGWLIFCANKTLRMHNQCCFERIIGQQITLCLEWSENSDLLVPNSNGFTYLEVVSNILISFPRDRDHDRNEYGHWNGHRFRLEKPIAGCRRRKIDWNGQGHQRYIRNHVFHF